MVIVIIAIIASVTLPKFVNFKTSAIERSEDAIAGNLNTALKIYQLSYIAKGGDPTNGYPSTNPFALLQYPPPYTLATWYVYSISYDSINWQYEPVYSKYCFIYCPHYYGYFAGGGPKGRCYAWVFRPYGGDYNNIGDFTLLSNGGH